MSNADGEAMRASTPYQQTAQAAVEALTSDAERGLSSAEARERLGQFGPNELQSQAATPWWLRLLEQFQDTLVIILLVATLISFVEWWLQNPRETPLPYEGIVILAIVILNALLGFVQESRAEQAVQALKSLAAPDSTVLRDGQRQRVPSRDLVPGDIVLVEMGDRAPARWGWATASTCSTPVPRSPSAAPARSLSAPRWTPRLDGSPG